MDWHAHDTTVATSAWRVLARVAWLGTLAVSLALVLALASAALVQAGVPDPRFCRADTALVASPGGGFAYTVLVRNDADESIAGAPVVLDFNPAVGIRLCADQDADGDRRLVGTTDAAGRVTFWVKAGGVTTGRVEVSAVAQPLAQVRPRTTDFDGDLDVDAADRAALAALVGSAGPIGDLDLDGGVDAADQSLLETRLGHTCALTPVLPASWGALKAAFR